MWSTTRGSVINETMRMQPPLVHRREPTSKIFLINRAHMLRASLEQSESCRTGCSAIDKPAVSPSAAATGIRPRLLKMGVQVFGCPGFANRAKTTPNSMSLLGIMSCSPGDQSGRRVFDVNPRRQAALNSIIKLFADEGRCERSTAKERLKNCLRGAVNAVALSSIGGKRSSTTMLPHVVNALNG